ncbi:MAG: chitobiase/beta-hexosaminidase C-terminal domain-containing protein [Verrucomicrobiales bacterium]|jgi:hypothetical protein|nr:chitobiase/beta-hexosaminidase C-terminal domain-containing protein [Verrucomicrobiales bacterium]
MSVSPLERLQLDTAARLDAAARLRYVPVNTVRPRENLDATLIQQTINNALAGLLQRNGKAGVAIFVGMPTAANDDQLPGPNLQVTLGVRVIENPLVNMGATGTLQSAEEVALIVLNELHQLNLGLNGAVLYADKNCLAPDLSRETSAVIYDCYLRMGLGLKPCYRAMTPRIDVDGDTATLTAADGDAIYYTLDGDYPSPSAATLYHGAFPVQPGTLVRAVAYSPTLAASNCATRQF